MATTSELTHGEAARLCGLRLEHYGNAMNCRLYDGERVVFDGHMCDSWDHLRAVYTPGVGWQAVTATGRYGNYETREAANAAALQSMGDFL